MIGFRATAGVALNPRRAETPWFQIGDRVSLGGKHGVVVGVRYGNPAYDIQLGRLCLRNVAPQSISLARKPAGSVAAQPRAAA